MKSFSVSPCRRIFAVPYLLLCYVLCAMTGLSRAAAAPLPEAPPEVPVRLQAQQTALDDFAYGDEAAARAVWQPVENSLPVEAPQPIAGRRAVRLPVNWEQERRRAAWQRALKLDLSRADGFSFWLYVDDLQKIAGSLTLYFASGDGWYAASFTAHQGWQQVRLDKSQFTREGTPAGWNKISAVRFSAWKPPSEKTPASTFIALDDFRFSVADIVVLLNSAAFGANAEEEKGIRNQARDTVALLDKLGVEAGTLDDRDVEAGGLVGRRIAFLPHNPAVPEAVQQQIEKFIAAGGKVFLFYATPPRVLNALGFAAGKWMHRDTPGQFAEMRFDDRALPNAPRQLRQDSWNISTAIPKSHNARRAGEWFDENGRDSGQSALLVSDNGAFLSHILLKEDEAGREQLMLALLGRFVPQVWPAATEKVLAGIGKIGEWNNLQALQTQVTQSADAGAAQYIQRAMQLQSEAAKVMARQPMYYYLPAPGTVTVQPKKTPADYARAIKTAQDAQRAAQLAYAAMQKPRADEMRAVWCHSAYGVSGMSWNEAIKTLADNGFNAIMPNMLWGGIASYPSEVLPVDEGVKTQGDQIAQCVAAAKQYGVQVHVWKVNWNLSTAPTEFVEKMRAEKRTQQNADGTPRDWLCPSHPANFALERDSMLEIARRYDVNGLHFDYIRYPDADACYCAGCRARFETKIGDKVANWPQDVRAGKWRDQYRQFRRDNISRLVEAVSVGAHKIKPKIKISAAVFREWPDIRDTIGQDWVLWCKNGWLDFVCPMNYTANPEQLDSWLSLQMSAVNGATPLVSGVGVTLADWNLQPDQTIQQINLIRHHQTAGFILFNYTPYVARTILPALRMGITAK